MAATDYVQESFASNGFTAVNTALGKLAAKASNYADVRALAAPFLNNTVVVNAAYGGAFATDGTTGHLAGEDDGGINLVDAAGRLWTRIIEGDSINTKWFNIDKTGATGVADALEAIIAVAATLKLPLHVDEGVYLIDAAKDIVIPNDFVFKGAGKHKTKFVRDTLPTGSGPDTNLFFVGSNIYLADFTVENTAGEHAANENNTAILARSKSNILISNVCMLGAFYVGVKFDTCDNARCVNSDAYGIKNRAFYSYQTCNDIVFENCFASGYEINTTTKYTAYTFQYNATATGVQTGVWFIGCHSIGALGQGFGHGQNSKNCGAVGCSARLGGSYGFLIQNGSTDTTITGCEATESGLHDLYITQSHGNIVTGFVSRDAGNAGVRIHDSNKNLVGCIVTGANNQGLYISGVSEYNNVNVTAHGNTQIGVQLAANANNNLLTGTSTENGSSSIATQQLTIPGGTTGNNSTAFVTST